VSDNGGFVPPSPEPLADFWEQVNAGMAAEYGRLFDERFDGLLNGDNSSPGPQGILGAKKLTAYMEISDELAFRSATRMCRRCGLGVNGSRRGGRTVSGRCVAGSLWRFSATTRTTNDANTNSRHVHFLRDPTGNPSSRSVRELLYQVS